MDSMDVGEDDGLEFMGNEEEERRAQEFARLTEERAMAMAMANMRYWGVPQDPGGGADTYAYSQAVTGSSIWQPLGDNSQTCYPPSSSYSDGLQTAWQLFQLPPQLEQQPVTTVEVPGYSIPSAADADTDYACTSQPDIYPESNPRRPLVTPSAADVKLGELDPAAFLDCVINNCGLQDSTFWAHHTIVDFFLHCRAAKAIHDAANSVYQYCAVDFASTFAYQTEISARETSASDFSTTNAVLISMNIPQPSFFDFVGSIQREDSSPQSNAQQSTVMDTFSPSTLEDSVPQPISEFSSVAVSHDQQPFSQSLPFRSLAPAPITQSVALPTSQTPATSSSSEPNPSATTAPTPKTPPHHLNCRLLSSNGEPCPFTCDTLKDIKRHIDQHNKKRYYCGIGSCTKSFARKDELPRHRRCKHPYGDPAKAKDGVLGKITSDGVGRTVQTGRRTTKRKKDDSGALRGTMDVDDDEDGLGGDDLPIEHEDAEAADVFMDAVKGSS